MGEIANLENTLGEENGGEHLPTNILEISSKPRTEAGKLVGEKQYTEEEWQGRKKEIIEKAIGNNVNKEAPYKKIGNKEYTREQWEERQKEIIKKAMGGRKTEMAEKTEVATNTPQDYRLKSQLEIAMERAEKIDRDQTKEQANTAEIPTETIKNIESEFKPEEKNENSGKKTFTVQKRKFLDGETVQIPEEKGNWKIKEYYPDINSYDVTNGRSILKVSADKLQQKWFHRLMNKFFH